jgi:hypothetical protein
MCIFIMFNTFYTFFKYKKHYIFSIHLLKTLHFFYSTIRKKKEKLKKSLKKSFSWRWLALFLVMKDLHCYDSRLGDITIAI